MQTQLSGQITAVLAVVVLTDCPCLHILCVTSPAPALVCDPLVFCVDECLAKTLQMSFIGCHLRFFLFRQLVCAQSEGIRLLI